MCHLSDVTGCFILLQLGRLFDLQWKLGVAVSSSNCSNLGAPFVALSYKISDANGKARGYAMELSYPEFQVRVRLFVTPIHCMLVKNESFIFLCHRYACSHFIFCTTHGCLACYIVVLLCCLSCLQDFLAKMKAIAEHMDSL